MGWVVTIKTRNSWKEIAVSRGYRCAEKIVKDLGKEIKKAVANDKKVYFNKDFGECCDRSNAWKTAKVLMGLNNNLTPTEIRMKDERGDMKHITNPQTLA